MNPTRELTRKHVNASFLRRNAALLGLVLALSVVVEEDRSSRFVLCQESGHSLQVPGIDSVDRKSSRCNLFARTAYPASD